MSLNFNLGTHGSAKHCNAQALRALYENKNILWPTAPWLKKKNALANFKRTDAENVKLFLHKHLFAVVSLNTSAGR